MQTQKQVMLLESPAWTVHTYKTEGSTVDPSAQEYFPDGPETPFWLKPVQNSTFVVLVACCICFIKLTTRFWKKILFAIKYLLLIRSEEKLEDSKDQSEDRKGRPCNSKTNRDEI